MGCVAMTEDMPEVRFVGYPDGDRRFVPEIGLELGTFTQEPGGNFPALKWHIPLNCRGPFRPDQLANFDAEHSYTVDKYGYVKCLARTADDKPCSKQAQNRWPRCVVHGGRLHPLDKLLAETGEPETEVPMNRYQMFLAGHLTVDDLDDEELMAFGFRDAKGKLFKPKNIPRDMVTAFTRAIFDRSLDKLKTSALEAANTLAGIMADPSVDPSVRRLCAESILDRTVGKAPLLVSISANAAWETIFESISAKPLQEAIDVEFTEEKTSALPQSVMPPNTNDPETGAPL